MKKLVLTIFTLICFGLTTNAFARPVAPHVKYHNPKAGGVALDWCKTWGKGCGQPAANYFCRAKGHRRAIKFTKKNNVGYTRIMKTGRICQHRGCDSFTMIKCENRRATRPQRPRVQRFHAPKYQGVALDWCYTWGANCGQKPANMFCRNKGYGKGAIQFKKANNIGYTKLMRTGQICNNASCDSYKFIDCKR